MKRLAAFLIVASLLLVGGVGAANQYDTVLSASQTNTNVSFGFTATKVILINAGPNSVRLNFQSRTATTSNFELKIGETLSLSVDKDQETGWTGFGAICASGETASVRVMAQEAF